MGATASGAQDSNNFRKKMDMNCDPNFDDLNCDPNFDDLTYNGLLNEYYYNFGKKNNAEILTAFTASAICIDPLTK